MSLESLEIREEGNPQNDSNIFLVDKNVDLENNLNKNSISVVDSRDLDISDIASSAPPIPSSPSPLCQNNFLPGTTETKNNLKYNILQNNSDNINLSNNKSSYLNSVETNKFRNNNSEHNFGQTGLPLGAALKDDFGAIESEKSLKQEFEGSIDPSSKQFTRPSTLPITSCLDYQSDIMTDKNATPEDINQFLEDGFQLISCQEKICDLYVRLNEPGSEELLATFGSIILSIIDDIKTVVTDKERLGQIYERERDENADKVKRMEDEIEGQMKTVDTKIRNEEKKKFDNMNKEWKSRHFEEVNNLRIEIEKLKHNAAKSKWNYETTGKLEEELKESKIKNDELHKNLDEFMKNYSSLENELGLVKTKLEKKETELVRQKKLSKEDSIEIDNLISQIEVLQTSNKTLHEKTDDLCEALRICRSYYKTQMKQKSALTKDDFIQKYLDESCISLNRTFSREQQLSEIKSNKTYSSGFGEDEDLDSSGIEELENLNSPSDFFLNHLNNNSNNSPNNNSLNNNSLTNNNSFNNNNNNNIASPKINNNNNNSNLHPLSNSLDRKTCSRVNSINNNAHGYDLNGNHEPERIFKVVLAGDAAVGKSSLIMRLCKNQFVSTLSSTVGVDFQTKTLRVDGKLIALQIWDTAGQERFRSIAKSYFRRADGVLLLYDITYEKSFLSVRDWLETIQDGAQKSIPIMLIGNKSDLRVGEMRNNCVKVEHGMDLARDENCLFVEASAKSGEHIQEAVVELTRSLMAREDLEVQTAGLRLDDEVTKKSTCCG